MMATQPQKWRVKMVTDRLLSGAVIAYPTEAVWGLGCIPESESAVQRILDLKNRPRSKGLIMVASSMDQILPYIEVSSDGEMEVLKAAWPGPTTFIVRKSKRVPGWISGKHKTVAVRVSDHTVIQHICEKLGKPIVSTSANPIGMGPAKTSMQVKKYFPVGVDHIFPGDLGGRESVSEIRVLATGEVIRVATR